MQKERNYKWTSYRFPAEVMDADEARRVVRDDCPECKKVINRAEKEGKRVIVRLDMWDAVGLME